MRVLIQKKSEAIEVVKTIKYLGVIIDDRFIWHEHINKLRQNLNSAIFAIAYLKRYATTAVQQQVYYSLVESRLRYGVLAWGNASRTHIEKLINLQRRIIRAINTNSFHFKVLDVTNIFKMTAILEYYNDSRFQEPISHTLNTRSRAQGLLYIPEVINTYGRRQLSYVIPSLINHLPADLKNIQNFKKRKKLLKRYYLHLTCSFNV